MKPLLSKIIRKPIKNLVKIKGSTGLLTNNADGLNALVNGRSSTATVVDHEGIVKTCLVGEVRFSGGRRVHNKLVNSNLFHLAPWSKNGGVTLTSGFSAPDGTLTAYKYTTNNTIAIFQTLSENPQSKRFVFTIHIKPIVDNFSFQLQWMKDGVAVNTASAINLTIGVWARVSLTYTYSGTSGTTFGVYFYDVNGYLQPLSDRGYIWKSQLENTTGQSNNNPSEVLDSTVIYNAGVVGIYYSNRYNGNTVASNIVTEAQGALFPTVPVILSEPSSTNYFLQSSTPATQSITLTAGTYTCWLDDTNGLGSITLTGGATGVATAASQLTFVTSGAAILFTVAGAENLRTQVEPGSYRTSYIPTTTAAVTRATDSIKLPLILDTNFKQTKGIILHKVKMLAASSAVNNSILSFNTGVTDFVYSNDGFIYLSDGTNTTSVNISGYAINDTLLICVAYNYANGLMSLHVSKNSGVWIDSVNAIYDKAFPIGANILCANGNTNSMQILYSNIKYAKKSIFQMQNWIKTKATLEAS